MANSFYNRKAKTNRSKVINRLRNNRTVRQRVKDALSTLISREMSGQNWPYQQVTVIEGQPLRISKQFTDYAAEGYGGNPWIYRAIRKVVDTASEIDWKVQRNTASGDSEDVENTPLMDRWDHPNPSTKNQSAHDFLETIILHLELSGNCFVHRAAPNNELNVLRPDLVEIIPGPNRTIARYNYTIDESKGTKIPYKPEEILHIMLVDPVNELDGVAPAEAAARSIDLNNSSRQWNFSKIQNTTGLGHVFLTGDQPFTENQIEQVKEAIDEQYKGPANAGKMAVVEANQIAPLSETAKDMDWAAVMDISAIEVSVAFGVPYVLLHPAGATYENLDHAKRQLFTETVFPLLDKIKDAFNGWLTPLYDTNLELVYDKEDINALQEDTDATASRAFQLSTSRIITVNEAREMIGLETRPDCDVWLEPSSLLTSPATGEAPTPEELAPPVPVVPTAQPVVQPPTAVGDTTQLVRAIGELRRKYRDIQPKRS